MSDSTTTTSPASTRARFNMAHLMRLDTNGAMTALVQRKLDVGASILAFIWLLDFAIWSACSYYILHGTLGDLAFVVCPFVGLAVGSIIMLLDRAIITSDTTRNKKVYIAIGARVLLALGFSMITALPLEVLVYLDKVENRIEFREDGRKDALKETAREATKAEYATFITDAEESLNKAKTAKEEFTAKTVDNTEKAITAYKEEQDKIRASIVERYKTAKDGERGIISSQQALALRESQGGLSGQKGRGPLVATLEEGVKTATARLQTLEQGEKSELDAHDARVRARLEELRSESKDNTKDAADLVEATHDKSQIDVDRLRAELETKLKAINLVRTDGEYDQLKDEHGPAWKEARGFIPYMDELVRLSEEDQSTYWGIWICRLFFILLSMVVTFWKLTVGTAVRRYYSLGAFAQRGDADAAAEIRAMGFDVERFATEPEVRDTLLGIAVAREKLRDVRRQWKAKVADLAQPVPGRTGALECRPQGEVNTILNLWGQGEPGDLLLEFRNALAKAEAEGIESGDQREFAWALEDEPFAVDASVLVQYGWADPQPVIDAGRSALRDFETLAEKFGEGYERWFDAFAEWVRDNPDAPRTEVNQQYRHFYRRSAQVPRRRLMTCQTALKLAQRDMPELRPELTRLLSASDEGLALMEPDPMRVLRPLGWTGPEPTAALPAPADDPALSVPAEDEEGSVSVEPAP